MIFERSLKPQANTTDRSIHIMRPLTNEQWPPILLYEYMSRHHGDPVQHTAAMLLHHM